MYWYYNKIYIIILNKKYLHNIYEYENVLNFNILYNIITQHYSCKSVKWLNYIM